MALLFSGKEATIFTWNMKDKFQPYGGAVQFPDFTATPSAQKEPPCLTPVS